MKVYIDTDELHPVYVLSGPEAGTACEVPDEMVARWKQIESQWDAMQIEMERYFRAE